MLCSEFKILCDSLGVIPLDSRILNEYKSDFRAQTATMWRPLSCHVNGLPSLTTLSAIEGPSFHLPTSKTVAQLQYKLLKARLWKRRQRVKQRNLGIKTLFVNKLKFVKKNVRHPRQRFQRVGALICCNLRRWSRRTM